MIWKNGMTFDDYVKWLVGENKQSLGDTRLLFGAIPAYPTFMTLAVLVVIILCVVQLKRKHIPLKDFEIGLVIVVPCAIIGGSVFGKIFLPNYQQWHNIYKVVFFWDPGMSFFGCFFFGLIAGFAWFYKRRVITKISIWVYFDIIIVNVLIGQAIGRWGNLYNQEILGLDVTYAQISWLPDFIKHRLFYFPTELAYFTDTNHHPLANNWIAQYVNDPSYINNFSFQDASGATIYLKDVLQQPLQFKAPLFLIEASLNLVLWLILTFGVRNLHKIINYKHNPWHVHAKAFPSKWNHQYPTISVDQLEDWPTLAPIKYKQLSNHQVSLNLENIWRKAYFWKTPDYELIHPLKQQNEQFYQQFFLDKQHLTKAKFNQKYDPYIRILRVNPYAPEIVVLNNPDHYKTIKTGVLTGGYICGYTLIRIILETMRKPTEYMIANHAIADFIVLSLILMIGLLVVYLTQFIIPYKWREIGWLYEKSY